MNMKRENSAYFKVVSANLNEKAKKKLKGEPIDVFKNFEIT